MMDVYPYREDGLRALQLCVKNTEKLLDMAHRLKKSGFSLPWTPWMRSHRPKYSGNSYLEENGKNT